MLNTPEHDPLTGFSGLALNATGIWIGGQVPGGTYTQGTRAVWSQDVQDAQPQLTLAHFEF
jgi:hypothetical protein